MGVRKRNLSVGAGNFPGLWTFFLYCDMIKTLNKYPVTREGKSKRKHKNIMAEFTVIIKNQELNFKTNEMVFSPRSLDSGTAAMLSVAEFLPEDKVLDLGCGYGPIGILAAKFIDPGRVVMCDISEDAVQLARINAAKNGRTEACRIVKSDGFSAIPDRDFTKIFSNPPYHTDFSVAKKFIEDGFLHLAVGGMMYMVTKRREWYKNKLIAVFGGVHIDEIDGYYVFTAEKQEQKPKAENIPKNNSEEKSKKREKTLKLSKKLARKEAKKYR